MEFNALKVFIIGLVVAIIGGGIAAFTGHQSLSTVIMVLGFLGPVFLIAVRHPKVVLALIIGMMMTFKFPKIKNMFITWLIYTAIALGVIMLLSLFKKVNYAILNIVTLALVAFALTVLKGLGEFEIPKFVQIIILIASIPLGYALRSMEASSDVYVGTDVNFFGVDVDYFEHSSTDLNLNGGFASGVDGVVGIVQRIIAAILYGITLFLAIELLFEPSHNSVILLFVMFFGCIVASFFVELIIDFILEKTGWGGD